MHDLRRSHASMLIALDHSVVDVQRRLGHRTPDITLRIYAHEWQLTWTPSRSTDQAAVFSSRCPSSQVLRTSVGVR